MPKRVTSDYNGLNATPLQPGGNNSLCCEKILPLINASKEYYKTLTSINGRFAHFEYEDKLFPFAKPIASEDCFLSHRFYDRDGNFILVGEGGCGKTTALLKAWKDLLTPENLPKYKMIPVFIPLNEANSAKEDNFIDNYTQEHYGFQINEAPKYLNNYQILLLLDGFNEITIRVNGIITEFKKLSLTRKIKVVLTSRYDFSSTYMLEGFMPYCIQLLEPDVIREYLQKHNVTGLKVPYDLLTTPMMLTLFTNTNLMKQRISNRICGNLPFHENKTKGELIYNFMLCQVGKAFDTGRPENAYIAYIALFVVSPYIAYVIERQGSFSFAQKQMIGLIRKALVSFKKETFTFLFDSDLASLAVFGSFPDDAWQGLPNSIAAFLKNTLALILDEGENSSFRHQYFRDYFVASYIILDIRLALQKKEIPQTMMERMVPDYIAVFIGDCLQEYESKRVRENEESLECLLDMTRNKKAKDVSLLISNIVNMLALARDGDLSETDFHNVDLSRVSLNSLCFSMKTHKANFKGTNLAANTFLPQGHIEQVRSAVYSEDGRCILSAGDTTIKEWDVITGQCLMTYVGHENLVNSAIYSPDGHRILSAANDNTIKEWDRITGQCLCTWKDHKGYVTKAIYSPDGSKIFSSSWDGTVLCYQRNADGSWGTGKKVAQHEKNVKAIAVSEDCLYCLTASGDNTVKEWRIADGEFIGQYLGHTDMVNSVMYSPDYSQILTGSYDGTVRIFDRFSYEEIFRFDNGSWVRSAIYDVEGEAILIASHGDSAVKELKRISADTEDWNWHTNYLGHGKAVTNVSISFDGSKVLSTSEDGSVREWDRLSSQCIREYSGNMFSTTDTVYSNDGLLVLTIHGSEFTVSRRNDGIPLEKYSCHNPITSVDFSPDDQFIIATSGAELCEWNREKEEKVAYHLEMWDEDLVAEHARYADGGSKILCLIKSLRHSHQVAVCVFKHGNTSPEWNYTLSVDAIGVEPLSTESAFLTISPNAVIRKWDIETGKFLGVEGVKVSSCDFSQCCFLDWIIREIITESDVIRDDIYISTVIIEGQKCQLDGRSLVIYSKDNIKCFLILEELYQKLKSGCENTFMLSGPSALDMKSRFRVLWESEQYIKKKIDPYTALSKGNAWKTDWIDMWNHFLSRGKLKDELMDLRETILLKGILSELLSDYEGKLSADYFYNHGLIYISQIDAGICSLKLQHRLIAALIEAFPNLQFLISSSAEEIGKGGGAVCAMKLGAQVLVLDS